MKKLLLILTTLMFLGFGPSIAQENDNIRSARISLFTDRMQLTPTQAQKFWPVYNQYDNERRALGKQIRSLKSSGNASSLQKIESLESEKLQLRNKYKNNFLNIISASQLAKMYSAEEEFKKMLVDQINKD